MREQDASRDTGTESGIDVVLVTGLSGAGRGTAAKVLEDLGWYVADNLPPELIARMVDLGLAAGSRITQLAVVMDVRFLPNPHWVDELRPHTGQHPAVRDYVLGQPGAAEFLDTYHQLLDVVIEGYRREGKRYMTVAIGCTGGKHRSVAMAEALASRLQDDELTVRVLHRDLGRE